MPELRAARARRVLEAMIAATPRGARPPWKTRRSLATIGDLLADGISELELRDHIAGAAALIERGLEAPRWWSVGNLFGPKTLETWQQQIWAMRARDERARLEAAAEAKRAAEHAAAVARPQQVQTMALHQLAAAARAVLQERWANERADTPNRQANE